jgi:hypothetical protein
VDYPDNIVAVAITDDEESEDDADENDENDSVEFIDENLNATHDPADVIEIEDADESESMADGTNDAVIGEETAPAEDDNDVDSVGAVRRRSTRRRTKRSALVVDFDNLAYSVTDGVLHINPNVLAEAREDMKITSENIFEGKTNVRVPPTAGISQRAVRQVTGLPDPVAMGGEPLV